MLCLEIGCINVVIMHIIFLGYPLSNEIFSFKVIPSSATDFDSIKNSRKTTLLGIYNVYEAKHLCWLNNVLRIIDMDFDD